MEVHTYAHLFHPAVPHGGGGLGLVGQNSRDPKDKVATGPSNKLVSQKILPPLPDQEVPVGNISAMSENSNKSCSRSKVREIHSEETESDSAQGQSRSDQGSSSNGNITSSVEEACSENGSELHSSDAEDLQAFASGESLGSGTEI